MGASASSEALLGRTRSHLMATIPDDFCTEWPSIQAIGEILSVLATAANRAGLEV